MMKTKSLSWAPVQELPFAQVLNDNGHEGPYLGKHP